MPCQVIACFDTKHTSWRKKLVGSYKQNRKSVDLEPIHQQCDWAYDVTQYLGIPTLRVPGYEADDAIATLCQILPDTQSIEIYSEDKDLGQLVSKKIALKRARLLVTLDNFEKVYGCDPQQLTSLLALSGDAADNIGGVKGIL